MYVIFSPSGTKTFHFDYRLVGPDGKTNRETLTIGRYEPDTESRTQEQLDALNYGAVVSLADARALRDRASREVKAGVSPSKANVQQRTADSDADTFGAWVQRYFDFKSDPKSGDAHPRRRKPKGMHRTTFQYLHAKLLELESQRESRICALFDSWRIFSWPPSPPPLSR